MTTPSTPHRPDEAADLRFSIIVAVYNVERYLRDFFESIEKQTFDSDRFEVILIDDGSTDNSLETMRAWAAGYAGTAVVLSKQNGGQASARNVGMTHARGQWMTYTDPDDWVGDRYLEIVDRFITDHANVEMVATNRIFFHEDGIGELNGHPLRQLFAGGDQAVDLEAFPEYFHGSAPAAFVRRDVVDEHSLQFDELIRPNFEDGHFCVRYLLTRPRPIVAFLASAKYYYRKRADSSSTLQNSLTDPRRFTVVPERGYLGVLDEAIERTGSAPIWLQNMVLYELSWYFSSEEKPSGTSSAADVETGRIFVEHLGKIVQRLDDETIRSFHSRAYKPEWRDILLHGVRGDDWHSPYVVFLQFDAQRDMVKIAYRFAGTQPTERFAMGDRTVAAVSSKTRVHRYFEQDLLHERVIWLELSGTMRVFLDGTAVELRASWEPPTVTWMRAGAVRQSFRPTPSGPIGVAKQGVRQIITYAKKVTPSRLWREVRDQSVQLAARTWPARKAFGSAWVLMDRVHDANDSGEHLFRYLPREPSGHQCLVRAGARHPRLETAEAGWCRPSPRSRELPVEARHAELRASDLVARGRSGP